VCWLARRIQRVIETRRADYEPLLSLLAAASLRTRIATERLEKRKDGRRALQLNMRTRDGTAHILMERTPAMPDAVRQASW